MPQRNTLSTALVALVAAAALSWTCAAEAAELGAVKAQRVQLERALNTAVNEALERLVGLQRAHAVVSVRLSGQLVKEKQVNKAQGMSFTMGRVASTRRMKLPGLPSIGQSGKLSQPVKIRLDPKGKATTTTRLVTEVKQVRVRLYVDPKLDKDRLAIIKTTVADLAGLDPDRGDALNVVQLAPPKKASVEDEPSPWRRPVYIGLAVVPLTLLLGAALIAAGLMRGGARGKADIASTTTVLDGRGEGGAEAPLDPEEPLVAPGVAAARQGRFAELSDATGEELRQVLAGLEREEAASVLALAPLKASAVRAAASSLEPERVAEIAERLGTEQVVQTEGLSRLEARCGALLEQARNPAEITVGGSAQLTRLLTLSGRGTTREVLARLERSNAALARQAREQLLQFEDLPELTTALRRRAVSAVEATVLARALHGAEERLATAVQEVLSKRQASYLAEERRLLAEVSEEQVEAARETIQRVMTRLNGV